MRRDLKKESESKLYTHTSSQYATQYKLHVPRIKE